MQFCKNQAKRANVSLPAVLAKLGLVKYKK